MSRYPIFAHKTGAFAFRSAGHTFDALTAFYHFEGEVLGDPSCCYGFDQATVTDNSLMGCTTFEGRISARDFRSLYTQVSEQDFIELHRKWKASQNESQPDPRKPTQMSTDRSAILDIAKDEELDKLGELYGIRRKGSMGVAETDDDFRKRLLEAARNIGKEPVPDLPEGKSEGDKLAEFFFPEAKNRPEYGIKCECGVEASGSGGRHSSWCPKG